MSGRKASGSTAQVRPLTRDRLSVLLRDGGCRSGRVLLDSASPGGWTAGVLAEWGHCGMIAEQDDRLLGFLALAPAASVPHEGSFLGVAFGADSALLMTAAVAADATRRGVGRALVQAAAADMVRRKVAALEALGSGALVDPVVDGLPDGWLRAVGFRMVRPHPLGARYRMELDTTVRWRPDLASTWERLRDLVTPPVAVEPTPFSPPDQQRGSSRVAPSRS